MSSLANFLFGTKTFPGPLGLPEIKQAKLGDYI
jgi:hypothetical protein